MLFHTSLTAAGRHRLDRRVRTSGRLLRRAAVLIGVALLTLLAPAASAHDAIVSTNPADGAQVDVVPGQIELFFNNVPLAVGAAVQVTGPDGAVVSTEPPQVADTTVIQAVAPDLPAGAYRVLWRVTSSDGHPLSGEFGFTATGGAVAAPEPAPEPSPSSPTPTTSSAAAPTPTATTETPDNNETPDDVGAGERGSRVARAGIGLGIAAVAVGVLALAARRLRSSLN